MSLHSFQLIDISTTAAVTLALFTGLAAYTLYGAIWRLYLSPIAHIPGPRFAALTFWNEFYYDVYLGGKYTWKLLEYHKSYGPVIRINPYEVHIYDPDFYDELYVGSTKAKTNKWYWSMRMFGQQDVSAFDTLDHDKHRQRREPWNPFFSKQSVTRLQPVLIQPVVDKLCRRLAEYQSAEKPITMINAFACVTIDIISEYSFPEGYNLLDKPEFDSAHYKAWMGCPKCATCSSSLGGSKSNANTIPTKLYPVLDSIPMWITKRTSPDIYLILKNQDDLLQQAIKLDKQRGNPAIKESGRPSMIEAFMNSPTLPESEKRPERIKAEAQIAIGAGTLTTAHALKAATYHILANPSIHAQLMSQLETQIPDPDNPPTLRALEQMPYLTAVMYETLRIFYGNSHRLQRIFPSRPLHHPASSLTIPPNMPISMSILHIHDHPRIFPEPHKFDPERWRGPEAPFKYLVPFSRGSRSCVGMELAKAEILTTVAGVMRRFGREMGLDGVVRERDVDAVYDVFNPAPSRGDNGLSVLIRRSMS